MTVSKQQQLEWLANNLEEWKSGYDYAVVEKAPDGYLYVRWPSVCTSGITKKEWRQERDKMQKQPAQDNSWHERGEFPPAGCECEVLHRGKWIKTVIIGMSPHKSCVYSLIGSGSNYAYDGIDNSHFFRPIRTEREKAIDDMKSLCAYPGSWCSTFKAFAESLYDAGYRKMKP